MKCSAAALVTVVVRFEAELKKIKVLIGPVVVEKSYEVQLNAAQFLFSDLRHEKRRAVGREIGESAAPVLLGRQLKEHYPDLLRRSGVCGGCEGDVVFTKARLSLIARIENWLSH